MLICWGWIRHILFTARMNLTFPIMIYDLYFVTLFIYFSSKNYVIQLKFLKMLLPVVVFINSPTFKN